MAHDRAQTSSMASSSGQRTEPPALVGVMDAGYAEGRTKTRHLSFRYRTRALMAARMYQRFGTPVTAMQILDLGAAEGRTMVETHRLLHAQRSVGVEYSRELIESSGELPPGCSLVQGDATSPPSQVGEGVFDLVTALAVLEHVESPEALAVAAWRALRIGGIFVATCPNGMWDRLSGALGLHKDEHHTGEFHRAKFESVAKAGGLQPVHYERFMLAPVGFLPYLGVSVSPLLGLKLDGVLSKIPIVSLCMVNQVFVAKKLA